jgi:hypothetical protein
MPLRTLHQTTFPTSRASRSSLSAMKLECRKWLSGVNSTHSNWPTNTGFSQRHSFILSAVRRRAVLPELVSKEDLPAASALNGIEFNFARAVGPALAGFVHLECVYHWELNASRSRDQPSHPIYKKGTNSPLTAISELLRRLRSRPGAGGRI